MGNEVQGGGLTDGRGIDRSGKESDDQRKKRERGALGYQARCVLACGLDAAGIFRRWLARRGAGGSVGRGCMGYGRRGSGFMAASMGLHGGLPGKPAQKEISKFAIHEATGEQLAAHENHH